MAAREQVRPLRLDDLRSVSPAILDPILKEERGRWRALLHWDFAPSANLVIRYVQMQALDGFVLLDDEEPAGYIYWVSEDHKGLMCGNRCQKVRDARQRSHQSEADTIDEEPR